MQNSYQFRAHFRWISPPLLKVSSTCNQHMHIKTFPILATGHFKLPMGLTLVQVHFSESFGFVPAHSPSEINVISPSPFADGLTHLTVRYLWPLGHLLHGCQSPMNHLKFNILRITSTVCVPLGNHFEESRLSSATSGVDESMWRAENSFVKSNLCRGFDTC